MDDLVEKKRKLEEIRAEREAKKRLIEQYKMSRVGPSLSSEVLSLSKLPADSSSVQCNESLPMLMESTVTSTVMSSPSKAVVEPSSHRTAVPFQDSADPTGHTQEDSKHSTEVMLEGAAVLLSADGAVGFTSKGDATLKGGSISEKSYHRSSRRASTTPYGSKESGTAGRPAYSHNHPQSFDCFRRWGGLESSDHGTGSARAAEVCALTPKICFGDERRLVIDIAVTTLLYRDGGAVSEHNPEPQVGAGMEKLPFRQGSTGISLLPFTEFVPCVAAAYTTPCISFSNDPSTLDETSFDTMGEYLVEDLSMILNSSYSWGHAFSAAARHGGARTLGTLESISAQVRQVPGLVMAWTIIPGTGIREASAGASLSDGVGASVEVSSQDLVILTPLVCDSEVTTLMAHPFSPPGVFIAGTASGRLVMWNIAATEWVGLDRKQLRARAVSSTGSASVLVGNPQRPLVSSFPSPQLHQGRVLALSVHGNPSNHYLYSISQEGRVCTWLGWQTLQPIVARSAYFEGGVFLGNVGTVAVFAGQRGSDSMTKVYMGTSDGAVIEGLNRNDRTIELHQCGSAWKKNSHTGINLKEHPSTVAYTSKGLSESRGGQIIAPSVSSVRPFLPSMVTVMGPSGSKFFQDVQSRGHVIAIALQSSPTHAPFRDHDYVVAAFAHGSCVAYMGEICVTLDSFVAMVTALKWSPTHTGIFASGDTEGVVSLWDINYSLSVPLLSVFLDQALGGFGYTSSSGMEAVAIPKRGRSALGLSLDIGLTRAVRMSPDEPAPPIGLAMDGTTEAVTSLAFSADGQWLFAGVTAGNIYVLELSEELVRLSGRSDAHLHICKEEVYSS